MWKLQTSNTVENAMLIKKTLVAKNKTNWCKIYKYHASENELERKNKVDGLLGYVNNKEGRVVPIQCGGTSIMFICEHGLQLVDQIDFEDLWFIENYVV